MEKSPAKDDSLSAKGDSGTQWEGGVCQIPRTTVELSSELFPPQPETQTHSMFTN